MSSEKYNPKADGNCPRCGKQMYNMLDKVEHVLFCPFCRYTKYLGHGW